jgi:hypothetical protein
VRPQRQLVAADADALANSGMVFVISVAALGTTALAVMPAFASSMAQVRTIAAMPALAAA